MDAHNVCQPIRGDEKHVEPAWRDIRFTTKEARRALPYVDRVLRDALHALAVVQDARLRLEVDPNCAARERLCSQRDRGLKRLNSTIDECHAVGVSFLDLTRGMIAFRSRLNCRDVSLIWRLGEPIHSAWSDLHAHSTSDDADQAACRS